MNKFLFGLLALLALGLPGMSWATPSNDNCTGFITSLPATISTPGTWCMTQNLGMATNNAYAITVSSDHVTIDCNDFSLDGSSVGLATGSIGIYSYNVSHTIVRHCGIRGFFYGVLLDTVNRSVVEDNHLDANTYIGIALFGNELVARGNLVTHTGGTSGGAILSNAPAIAIRTSDGADVEILDNTVDGVRATVGGGGTGIGISAVNAPGAYIAGNRVRNVAGDGAGLTKGISTYNDNGERAMVRDNDVSSSVGTGLFCANANARIKNNVVGGFTTLVENCGDAGGNDLTP